MNGVTVRVVSGQKIAARMKASKPLMTSTLERAVAISTANLHRRVVKEAFAGKLSRGGLFPISSAGNTLANRSGKTRSRIASSTFRHGDDFFGVVGSPDRHFLVNEVGARIKAKGSGMLVIPTKYVMSASGQLKGEWQGVSLRDVWKQRKLFVLGKKMRGGRSAFVARHIGDVYRDPRTGRMKRRQELLFLMVKEVNIAARWMLRTIARKAGPEIAATIGKGVKVFVERLGA